MISQSSSLIKSRHAKVRFGPSGVHIFNRCTGANLLFDEIIPPQVAWARAPRQVSIALTNACDLSCAHCFAPKNYSSLDFATLCSWLHELDTNGAIGVGFGGGEPTLYPRLAELCTYAAKRTGLAVTFTTHGHHLIDSLLAKLNGNVHFIRVSMDGIEATYERIRGRAFEALCKRIEAIQRITPFGINYVVNTDTLPNLDHAVRFASQVGATEFLLLPEQAVNGRAGVDAATTLALRDWVSSYTGSVRLAVSERGAEGLPTCNPFENETGLRAYAHVAADGVLKYNSYEGTGITIGNDSIMSAIQQLQLQTPEPK